MPANTVVNLRMTGVSELVDELGRFHQASKTRVTKSIVRGAMAPLRKAGRSQYAAVARIRTGALRQSLGSSRPKRLSGGVMYAIYKPRKEFKAVKNVRKKAASITVRTKRGREKGEVGRNIKPTKYAHLVEFGTSRSRAFPYMQTTFNRSKHQIIRGVEKGAVSQLTKEFNRLESRVNSARKR